MQIRRVDGKGRVPLGSDWAGREVMVRSDGEVAVVINRPAVTLTADYTSGYAAIGQFLGIEPNRRAEFDATLEKFGEKA